MIKYHFAYNENGDEVVIDNVTKEYRSNHSFHCMYCGSPMRARLGKSNAPHFAHSNDTDCGNSESDLHKYAKYAIRQKFLMSDSFVVGVPQKLTCGKKDCVFRYDDEDEGCIKEDVVSYDLKKYGYDTCEEERPVAGFIADILLTSTKFEKLPPILIEVAVTHTCDDSKINSNLRIIELPVKTISDLERFIKDGIFAPNPDEYHQRVLSRAPKFYGFAPKSYAKGVLGQRSICIVRVFLNGHIVSSLPEDYIPCDEIDKITSRQGVFSVLIDTPGKYLYYRDAQQYALLLAFENGFKCSNIELFRPHYQEVKKKMNANGVVYKIL